MQHASDASWLGVCKEKNPFSPARLRACVRPRGQRGRRAEAVASRRVPPCLSSDRRGPRPIQALPMSGSLFTQVSRQTPKPLSLASPPRSPWCHVSPVAIRAFGRAPPDLAAGAPACRRYYPPCPLCTGLEIVEAPFSDGLCPKRVTAPCLSHRPEKGSPARGGSGRSRLGHCRATRATPPPTKEAVAHMVCQSMALTVFHLRRDLLPHLYLWAPPPLAASAGRLCKCCGGQWPH